MFADARIAKLADVARLAIADLAPARIGVAKTVCRNVSFIRRYRMKDGSVKTNPGIYSKEAKETTARPTSRSSSYASCAPALPTSQSSTSARTQTP